MQLYSAVIKDVQRLKKAMHDSPGTWNVMQYICLCLQVALRSELKVHEDKCPVGRTICKQCQEHVDKVILLDEQHRMNARRSFAHRVYTIKPFAHF